MTHPRSTSGAADSLRGRWHMVSSLDLFAEYPAEIIFADATYLTAKAPGQTMIWWDAGMYQQRDAGTLTMGTATDALVDYPMRVDGNRLHITIPELGTVIYQRMEAAHSP